MTRPVLTISSKNYSSWSLRGWLLCQLAGLEIEEQVLSIDDHFLSMALYLASHYREKISVNEVAAHVGLHRNYAMRLFRRTCRTCRGSKEKFSKQLASERPPKSPKSMSS